MNSYFNFGLNKAIMGLVETVLWPYLVIEQMI